MNIHKEIFSLYRMACDSDSSVLITGGTGTGKTCLARMIHEQSSRRSNPFVIVNLASLHEGTLESELFGHERGAFTGASNKRVGHLEAAHGGTVFLDEIGELPIRLQARLLEVLNSGVIRPVGSNRDIKLNLRVIAATHRDLIHGIRNETFRQDLFHRLRVIEISLKPLSERGSELDEIIHDCLGDICTKLNRKILSLSPAVAELFETYSWPGNVRELRNVLEYAVHAAQGPELDLHCLPRWILESNSPKSSGEDLETSFPALGVAEFPLTLDYQSTLERFEKEYLQRAFSRNGGRVNRTARQIGINKTTLRRRLRAYRIKMN